MTERRWTARRFDKRVMERLAERKIRGGAPEDVMLTVAHMVMAEIVADYEGTLTAKDAEIAQLTKRNSRMIDILRRIYHGIQVDRAEIDDCIN